MSFNMLHQTCCAIHVDEYLLAAFAHSFVSVFVISTLFIFSLLQAKTLLFLRL